MEERKISEYLLDTSRMPAASKARFFLSCGFEKRNWKVFAEALKAHGRQNDVLNTIVSEYGTKFEIEGPLACPDERLPRVRTVWQIDADELAPRLITAYPVLK